MQVVEVEFKIRRASEPISLSFEDLSAQPYFITATWCKCIRLGLTAEVLPGN
jgi:hypothetical protein